MRLLKVLVFLLFPLILQAQISPGQEAKQLRKVLQERHILTQLIDDNFARKVLTVLLDEADPDKLFFLANDISDLQKVSLAIDNDLNTGTWTFFPAFVDVYKKSLVRAAGIIEKQASLMVDIHTKETQTIDTTWALDETGLQSRWRLLIKGEVLREIARVMPRFENKEGLAKVEAESRRRVQLQKKRVIARVLDHAEGVDNYLKSLFFKSVTGAYDPHSEYMSSQQMSTFLSSVGSEGYYFGFGLMENESGLMSVSYVIPGEPAWRSGKMEAGDVIEKIRWEGKEWMDLAGITQGELDITFAESNTATMDFTLRKPDGTLQEVSLKKAKRNNEQSLARSFLLQGVRAIGYVALPSFYSTYGGEAGARAANDVAKEIVKLKHHELDGIILDLRYNGGGSLKEAVDMAGIFIDVGPVGIEKNRGEDAETIKDFNRGTIYDGPLIILVNSLSASASEFLAAALQDYRRAVIVGTPTFGKAIAQEMFPLSPNKPEMNFSNALDDGGWGYSTITTSKIYRINGKSIQRTGLIPDITIPDYLTGYAMREQDMMFAIVPDSIDKKTYYTPFKVLPTEILRQKSEARVKNNRRFTEIITYMQHIRAQELLRAEILDWVEIQRNVAEEQRIASAVAIKNLSASSVFRVELHEFGKEHKDQNRYVDTINEYWMTNLSKDVTLEETYQIMCDYVEQEKKR